jgi:hypothetical protein
MMIGGKLSSFRYLLGYPLIKNDLVRIFGPNMKLIVHAQNFMITR